VKGIEVPFVLYAPYPPFELWIGSLRKGGAAGVSRSGAAQRSDLSRRLRPRRGSYIAQVVKQYAKRPVVAVERRIVPGSRAAINA